MSQGGPQSGGSLVTWECRDNESPKGSSMSAWLKAAMSHAQAGLLIYMQAKANFLLMGKENA